jgi:TRAP-type C4-dicarboxylate transport system permease small subunit
MNSMRSGVEVATKVLEWFITLCFFIILLLTLILVILRYGFNEAIIGGNELMEYLFIYTTSVGAAVALGRREHIKITWFIDKLAPGFRKAADIAGFLLIGFINAVMIRYSIPWIRSVGGFESPVLRLPNRTGKLIIPIGCGLVILYCLYHVVAVLASRSDSKGNIA